MLATFSRQVLLTIFKNWTIQALDIFLALLNSFRFIEILAKFSKSTPC